MAKTWFWFKIGQDPVNWMPDVYFYYNIGCQMYSTVDTGYIVQLFDLFDWSPVCAVESG